MVEPPSKCLYHSIVAEPARRKLSGVPDVGWDSRVQRVEPVSPWIRAAQNRSVKYDQQQPEYRGGDQDDHYAGDGDLHARPRVAYSQLTEHRFAFFVQQPFVLARRTDLQQMLQLLRLAWLPSTASRARHGDTGARLADAGPPERRGTNS